MTTRTLFFVFAFLLVVSLANAGDERSIKNLAKALTGLAADVDPARRLAQSRSIILVSGDKRRRVRNGTTLRPFRHHHVERKYEMERVAAVLPYGRGEAEDSQRVSLNAFDRRLVRRHSAATENWRFT